jgi:toxin-antitoxin system PIN domain toxin
VIRLLDVNFLVALGWPTHVHHVRASDWFLSHRREGWATCPVTESGFVRVSSNHRVISDARTPGEAAHLLEGLRAVGGHVFWTDAVSVADHADLIADGVHGSSAVTDAHLLLLARNYDGEVATFDRGLVSLANRLGARAALVGSN